MQLAPRFAICMLIALASCPAPSQAIIANGHYKMIDSGFPAEDFWPSAWLDNDRVLFTGVVLGTTCNEAGGVCGPRGVLNAMYVWNLSNNRLERYSNRIFYELCVQEGRIAYKALEKTTDQLAVPYAGQFGSERKVSPTSKYWFNRNSCRYHFQPPSWQLSRERGNDAEALLEKHGYIDYGPRDPPPVMQQSIRPSKPRLIAPNGQKFPIDIAAEHWPTVKFRLRYLPFTDEYFAVGKRDSGRSVAVVLFMTATARIRVVQLNGVLNIRGEYHPVRDGIVVNSAGGDVRGTAAGAYLVSDKHVDELIQGAVRKVIVSPNGCRIAFVYAASLDAVSQGYAAWKRGQVANTLRVMDLCHGG